MITYEQKHKTINYRRLRIIEPGHEQIIASETAPLVRIRTYSR